MSVVLNATVSDAVSNETLYNRDVEFYSVGAENDSTYIDTVKSDKRCIALKSWVYPSSGVAVTSLECPSGAVAYNVVASYAGKETCQNASVSLCVDFRGVAHLWCVFADQGVPINDSVPVAFNVSTFEQNYFFCYVQPLVVTSGENVSVYINGSLYTTAFFDYESYADFSWTALSMGVYYLNVSYGGSKVEIYIVRFRKMRVELFGRPDGRSCKCVSDHASHIHRALFYIGNICKRHLCNAWCVSRESLCPSASMGFCQNLDRCFVSCSSCISFRVADA
jgi:hypothetical protein